MRIVIGLGALALLAACGGNKAGNTGSANGSANAASAANAAAPAKTAASANTAANTSAPAGAARAVMMGGDAELDLCGSTARVKTGRTAIVREAPNAGAREIERLPAGTVLHICDPELETSDWAGVAYKLDSAAGCDLGRPSADEVPVPASCPSGWVQFGEDVEQIAG
jgi:type IV secretory pathway TrbL component